ATVVTLEANDTPVLQEPLEHRPADDDRLLAVEVLGVLCRHLPHLLPILHLDAMKVLNVLGDAGQKFQPLLDEVLLVLLPDAAPDQKPHHSQEHDDDGKKSCTQACSHRKWTAYRPAANDDTTHQETSKGTAPPRGSGRRTTRLGDRCYIIWCCNF